MVLDSKQKIHCLKDGCQLNAARAELFRKRATALVYYLLYDSNKNKFAFVAGQII